MNRRRTLAAALSSGALVLILLAPSAEAPQVVETVSMRPLEWQPLRDLEPSTTTTHPPSTTTQPTTTTTQAPPTTAPPVVDESPPDEGPSPTSPSSNGAGDGCAGWQDEIAVEFPAAQVPKACQVMLCESRGDPNIQNEHGSGASGLFQFLGSTWRTTTGLEPPASAYPASTQIAAAADLWASSGWSPWSCA